MPIFSAARNLFFPQDALFKRPTVFTWTETPEYSFHFLPPEDSAKKAAFEENFFFDNCTNFSKPSHEVNELFADGNTVDINDHTADYLRLYALKELGRAKPKYYLAPWLTVPFALNSSSGLFTPIVGGPTISGATVIRLRVVPFSIFTNRIDKRVKQTILDAKNKAKADNVTPPQLTLSSSNSATISAVWSQTSLPAIDEAECIRNQQIEITICDSSARYADQEFVDIKNGGRHVGRLYLLFLESIPHKVIFFRTEKATSTSLTITLLDRNASTALNTEVGAYLSDLNSIFKRIGMEHQAAAPILTMSNPPSFASPMTVPAVDSDNNSVRLDDPTNWSGNILDTVYKNLVERVVETERAQYVFVFLAGWTQTDPAIPDSSGTTGLSAGGARTSCIFQNNQETLCHEVSHALGLPHYFFEFAGERAQDEAAVKDSASEMSANACAPLVERLGIQSQRDFYNLLDEMNDGDSATVFQARASVQALFHKAIVDRFRVMTTHNLMDYRKPPTSEQGQSPAAPTASASTYKRNELVKHQIEILRFYVRTNLIWMNLR